MEIVFVAAILCVAAIAAIAMFLNSRNQASLRLLEKQITSSKVTLPLRLQAYERCLIFLERISPDSLLVRVGSANSANELQAKLLSNIRSEFEHNLSQQLYVSPEVWTYIVNSKNNIVGLINSCSTRVDPADKALELSKTILEAFANLDNSPTLSAKLKIKQEVAELY